jgi:hypothetical protein
VCRIVREFTSRCAATRPLEPPLVFFPLALASVWKVLQVLHPAERPLVATVVRPWLLQGCASLARCRADGAYFAAANRRATSFQFTTFQNAAM